MKISTKSISTSPLAPAALALAFVLSGCASPDGDATNNASENDQSCTGKCDSSDSDSGFRPLAALGLADFESSAANNDSADAGSFDAGQSADTGQRDAGSGVADAGSLDADAGAGGADAGADAAGRDASETAHVSFRIVGVVAEEHVDQVDESATLSAKIWATVGDDTPQEPMVTELAYDAEQVAFDSETVDASAIAGWDVLTIRVAGEFDERAFEQTFEFAAGEVEGTEVLPESDPFAAARDVDLEVITIDPELEAPDYHFPNTDGPFGLSGTEFWQKWPGGHNPTYSYSEGTEAGRKCMTASAIRFEAIMADPPASLIELVDNSSWSGRFFNWNDDFSHEDSTGWPSGAVLWAWRTHLIKWISQTGDDGRCYLPTRDLVERAAASCLQKARSNDGEIEGCQAN